MKTPYNVILLLFLSGIFFVFCTGKTNTGAETDAGNIYPFEYDSKDKAILLNGIINDSIQLRLFFDTGTSFNNPRTVLLSDSIRQFLQDSVCRLKVGDIEHEYSIGNFRMKMFDFVFQHFSKGTSVLDIDFFENEIIKISYREKYFQRLNNTNGLEDYTCVQLIPKKEYNGCLGIEIEVFVQGKQIKEIVMIDTGFNGFAAFNNSVVEKYGIDTEKAQKIQSLNHSLRQYRLTADSIKAGCVFSGRNTVEFLSEYHLSGAPHSGVLGNAFLENFEIILDFKNHVMYIKPLDFMV